MGRTKGALVKFTCVKCGIVDLVTGGSCNYKCSKCRSINGVDPLKSPQYLAHAAVAKAIRNGDLERPEQFACTDCHGNATEYDHRDYSFPLKVDPVCRGCNARRGPAISAQAATENVAKA